MSAYNIGFQTAVLRRMGKKVNKEATAASIISFIRRAALGIPLESEVLRMW